MASTTTWMVDIQLFEDNDHSSAKATLVTGTGPNKRRTVTGFGRARRSPEDANVPEIGAEIATARALRNLADRLLNTASEDISALEHTDVHLTH
jgi:hypothetical protein